MDKEDVVCVCVCVCVCVYIYIYMQYMYEWNITQPLKEWNNAIYSNMNGPRDYQTISEVLQRDKCQMISLICGI